MTTLSQLKGLGPKSAGWLQEVGVNTPEQLKELGAIRTFILLKESGSVKPSLNFLYALVGAIEGENWLNIAKHEKGRLLMELEGYQALQEMLAREGVNPKDSL